MDGLRQSGDRPSEQMEKLLAGHFLAQCLHAAAALAIPDLIAKGCSTIDELAAATGSHRPSLHRMLRTLASFGVFTEDADGRIGLTPLGDTLRSNTPDSVRDKALFECSMPIWSAWGQLDHSLRTGRPAFDYVHNATIWSYLVDNAQAGADFNRFMTAQSRLHNAAIIEAYDFSGIGTLVDVGGGHGATLAAALTQSPTTRGVLFDLPEVVASALETSKFGGRCAVVSGDMLQSVPAGGDAYLFKRVMMDLTDDETITVLRHCRTAMNPGGKVLVLDPMLPDGIEPHANRLVDLLMLVATGGQCRTQAQFRDLFEAGGFRLGRVIPTHSANFILEGVPR
jgi:hypothetical protein